VVLGVEKGRGATCQMPAQARGSTTAPSSLSGGDSLHCLQREGGTSAGTLLPQLSNPIKPCILRTLCFIVGTLAELLWHLVLNTCTLWVQTVQAVISIDRNTITSKYSFSVQEHPFCSNTVWLARPARAVDRRALLRHLGTCLMLQ
jgi:hypothetical protein